MLSMVILSIVVGLCAFVAYVQLLRHRGAKSITHLPIVAEVRATKPACRDCRHFDVELGQREMRKAVPFYMATQTIEPWRMGRVLKSDEDGKHLPMEQQGIDPALLELTWDDAGACKVTRELRFPIDSCSKFDPRVGQER